MRYKEIGQNSKFYKKDDTESVLYTMFNKGEPESYEMKIWKGFKTSVQVCKTDLYL